MPFRSTLHVVLEIPRFQSCTADGYIYRLHKRGGNCATNMRKHSTTGAPKLRLVFRLAHPLQCVHPSCARLTTADEALSPVLDGFRPRRVGFSNSRGLFTSQLASHLRHGYQSLGEAETVEKSRGFDSQQTTAKNR